MAIVQLKSTNPKFSFLIKKNPHSGMLLRTIRKGIACGWYTDESTFNVYFKDADNEVSYKQNEQEHFEYLNVSRYNTPLFPLNAINEFFSAPLKDRHELDVEGYEHTFTVNMIHIELVRYIEFFEKHLNGYSFDIKHQAHKSYTLTVTTRKSIYHLLHAVSVLCLFLSMFGNEYIDISDSILEKYMKSINIIDAPFYIRSLFVRNFLSSRDRFRKYKADIEKTDRYSIQFDFGGTALQRRNYIGAALPFNKSILDIGCGEGFYAIPFAPKIEGTYYAVDINEEAIEAVSRKAMAKEIDNIVTHRSIDLFLEDYNGERVDVIMTEVIEHMSQDEAKKLIRQIAGHVDFEHLIITTPNSDFNRFYELSGFRHDDHKWEMGQETFRQWLMGVIGEMDLQCEFVAVGDGVNEIRTTQGAILKKRGA
ncbi:class I SAM-dependent methyltransferase [Paenibacillus tarimensis]